MSGQMLGNDAVSSLIRAGSREPGAEHLTAPGGFAWYYLDILTPDGDGLVLIWAYGLPFLPGYAAASRRGRGERPLARPSLNLATYRRGRPDLYLLQELPEEPAAPGTGPLMMGGSSLRTGNRNGERSVEVRIDTGIPGTRERLRGTVRLSGPAIRMDAGNDMPSAHLWSPLSAPAEAEAELTLGARTVARLRGRGYHDCNASTLPLDSLGIDRWSWGRVPLSDREMVYYLLWPEGGEAPECLGYVFRSDGAVEAVPEVTVEAGRPRRTPGGLRFPESLSMRSEGRPWLEIAHRRPAEWGPFYLRMMTDARCASGERGLGWAEWCRPERVDLARHRPLVRMRVHRTRGRNSIWLPLFTGPRKGRVRRFVANLTGAA